MIIGVTILASLHTKLPSFKQPWEEQFLFATNFSTTPDSCDQFRAGLVHRGATPTLSQRNARCVRQIIA
jgi:hypothetical protein